MTSLLKPLEWSVGGQDSDFITADSIFGLFSINIDRDNGDRVTWGYYNIVAESVDAAKQAAWEHYAACIAPAFVDPPPLARVIYDFIDDCFERGRTPTPEEIAPFLLPKLRALVWDGQYAQPTKTLTYCVYETAYGWSADLETDEAGGSILWQRLDAASKALAQAAAQAHWEQRAKAFYAEAFEC